MPAMQAFVVAALTAATGPAAAPSAPDVDKVCAATPCRAGGFEAVVGIDKDHYTTVPVSHSPYIVDENTLLIFPGETVAVTFTVDNDKLRPVSAKRTAPHFPAKIVIGSGAPKDDPQNAGLPAEEPSGTAPNTVSISYGQFKPTGESGMVLMIAHNFPHALKLDAAVNVIRTGAYEPHATSTCPIRPKLSGYENWPDELGPIVLTHFRLLPDDGDMRCD